VITRAAAISAAAIGATKDAHPAKDRVADLEVILEAIDLVVDFKGADTAVAGSEAVHRAADSVEAEQEIDPAARVDHLGVGQADRQGVGQEGLVRAISIKAVEIAVMTETALAKTVHESLSPRSLKKTTLCFWSINPLASPHEKVNPRPSSIWWRNSQAPAKD